MPKNRQTYDEKSKQAGRLLLIQDLLLAFLVYLFAWHFETLFIKPALSDLNQYIVLGPFFLFPFTYLMTQYGTYSRLSITSLYDYTWSVIKAITISGLVLLAFIFVFKQDLISRSQVIIFASTLFFTIVIIRLILVWWYFKRNVESKENFYKVLIIGAGERAQRLSRTLHEHTEWGVHIVGHLDPDKSKVGTEVSGSKVIGVIDDIDQVLSNKVVDEVIFAVTRNMFNDVSYIVEACEEQGVKFRLMADIFDLKVMRTRLVDLAGIPLLTFEPVAQNELELLVKRMFDLVVTLISMPVVLPVMILVGLAIKLDSPGPVFFTQERVGKNKRLFKMMKFRSMGVGSEEKIKELEDQNEADGPNFKITNDPRITRVGRVLRKLSLDELPQLFNVIKGHMSLVGPRPMSLRDVALFDKGIQRKRFSVKPGLTCIWQISGRSNLSFEKWLELDLEYIENWSLGLDMKILLKTIPVVLLSKGAV